ncbi:MAG: hypothetical protein ABIH39_03870 [Candidatus Margulisiibacteriota bacterium]
MRRVICLMFSYFLMMNTLCFAVPFRGEEELIIDSGLTNDPKQVSSRSEDVPRFQDIFSPGKKIIFWAKVSRGKDDIMKYLQSVEWYAPDGRIWYKENQQVFGTISLMLDTSLKKTVRFELNTKKIPNDMQGVWAVRFIWNNSVINEHFFTYSKYPTPPTADQIAVLKDKMQRYDRSIAFSNKSDYYKLSSNFAREIKKRYKTQEVFNPDVVFAPDEQIVYMLNYDSKEFGLYSEVSSSKIYFFSPDGKLQTKQDPYWLYSASDPDYICGFRAKIDLQKLTKGDKNLYGVWKLVVYVPLVDHNFDERYFYIGEDTLFEITQATVVDMDNKVSEDELVESLNRWERHEREKAKELAKNKKPKVRIDVGMSKDEVVRLIGQPQKVITDRYDDAVVWVYTSINDGLKDPMNSVTANKVVSDQTNPGTGLAAGLVVTGILAFMPNKLEIAIRNDVVVGIKGAI